MNLVEILRTRVQKLEARKAEIEAAISEPGAATDSGYPDLLRELGGIAKVLDPWQEYTNASDQLDEAREMAEGDDADLAELAREEMPELESKIEALEAGILDRVLEDDPDADKPAIVEIRAGTGGNEAALFVSDLYRIYSRFADTRGWKTELMETTDSDAGGFKEVFFKVQGDDAFRLMRYEIGGHRVQRVPATESQGRIHTSAATVAVMPEVQEKDLVLRPEELEITAMRSSGPGGQSVNKTSSAIRVVHLPTGESVKCQVEKSQLRNKERALALLRARLYEKERMERLSKEAEMRKNQVGSGDRSQRIRTYNWPQNRVTDHRIGSNFSLEQVLEGKLSSVFEALQRADREAKLASL
ncbi:MAG TPA: peptide chain release factor 1 [Planctomycetes bacterium]|nr:peptide chain release factor 1 [Planctomycetota bacterium]